MSPEHVPEPTLRRDGTATLSPRRYSWPPFEPGNHVSVRHGAWSDAIVSANAEEVREALAGLCPWVINSDQAAVERYCRSEARSRILHGYTMKVALEKGVDAVPPYLWSETARAEANAAKFGSDLGLDPRGRAALAKDLGIASHFAADQLTELVSTGREVRATAEARMAAADGHGEAARIAHTALGDQERSGPRGDLADEPGSKP